MEKKRGAHHRICTSLLRPEERSRSVPASSTRYNDLSNTSTSAPLGAPKTRASTYRNQRTGPCGSRSLQAPHQPHMRYFSFEKGLTAKLIKPTPVRTRLDTRITSSNPHQLCHLLRLALPDRGFILEGIHLHRRRRSGTCGGPFGGDSRGVGLTLSLVGSFPDLDSVFSCLEVFPDGRSNGCDLGLELVCQLYRGSVRLSQTLRANDAQGRTRQVRMGTPLVA